MMIVVLLGQIDLSVPWVVAVGGMMSSAAAAVVLGGASILGGRGIYLGTSAGVILITLLRSILSVIQIPEAGRRSSTVSSSWPCCYSMAAAPQAGDGRA